jgi:hypothetical protein
MKARQAVLVAGFLLSGAHLGAAPAIESRWTLRADLTLNTPTDPLPGDAALVGSVQRRLTDHLFLEASLGPGLPVTTKKRGPTGTLSNVDLSSDVHGVALVGLQHRLGETGRWRVSIAAGPSFVSGGVFGTVPMARGETALAWHFGGRGVLLLSIGYESALKTSPEPFTAAECVTTAACPPYYKAGTGQVSTRWGLGFTF